MISVIQTLLRRKQRLRGDMLTLNIVGQTQIQQLSRKKTKKIHKLVLADRKLKLRKSAEELKIAEGSAFTILHEHVSIRKLCSKWVQRLLTVDQKQERIDNSERCLQLFQYNKNEF